jgi:hypothetical protein
MGDPSPELKVVVAPSGAGKTHLCASHANLVDADHLPAVKAIYTWLATTFGERWWDRPDYSSHIRHIKAAKMVVALEGWFEELNPEVLLTAEGRAVCNLISRGSLHPSEVLFWIPTAEELHKYQELRKHDLQPKWSVEKNVGVVKYYKDMAAEKGVRTISSLPAFL